MHGFPDVKEVSIRAPPRGSFTSSQRRDTTRDGGEAQRVKDILTH